MQVFLCLSVHFGVNTAFTFAETFGGIVLSNLTVKAFLGVKTDFLSVVNIRLQFEKYLHLIHDANWI